MPPEHARFVKDDGPAHARIIVIGEAPGRWENLKGKPFVGPSWTQRLHPWLYEVGLGRSDCYWTNTYPWQPNRSNNLSLIPRDERAHWVDQLHDRIAALDDPWLLVPTGDYALEALTGKRRITNHRGYLYEYTDRRDRTIKVIPTLHPAATFRQPSWERRCKLDWRRIASDAQFRDLRLPQRTHYIRPTFDDLRAFGDEAARADILGFDIETPRTFVDQAVTLKSGKTRMRQVYGPARITCIGLAVTPDFSLTVPLTESYWGSRTLPRVWAWLRQLMASAVPKVGQSGMPFDLWWLRQPGYDCPIENYRYDTRWMHHCLDSLDQHSLEYMCSLDIRTQFWKNEGKVEGDLERAPRDLDQFWAYNGKDVAYTVELANLYEPRLVKAGKWDFYCDWYLAMFEPLIRMSLHGTRLDDRARRRHVAQMAANMIGYQDALTQIAGEELYTTGAKSKGNLSNVKLTRFLYETLRLPKVLKTRKKKGGERTKSLTADEVTVRRLMISYPEKLGEAGSLILDYRHDAKQVSSYSTRVADADGRVRSSYGMASTLRLTSSKNPGRTGRNMQNIDRERAVREMFLPDEDAFFLEVDLSQAESRVVYALTGDPELIEIAHSNPWEFDDHKRTASIVFQVPPEQVDKEQRQYGKKTRHAGNYGMQGKQMSDDLLKEAGIIRTPEECNEWLERLHARDPGIRRWHLRVRRTALRDGRLVDAFGGEVSVRGLRFTDDLYRMLYAWEPQGTVGKITNRCGLIPLDDLIQREGLRSRVNLQVHDSLTTSTYPDEAWRIACFLRDSFEEGQRDLRYGPDRTPLVIPIELKLGRTLAGDIEFKKFPSRSEFMQAVEEICREASIRIP